MVRYEPARRVVRLEHVRFPAPETRYVTRSEKRAAAKKARRRRENMLLAFAAVVAFAGIGWSLSSTWKSTPDLASRPFSTVAVTVAPGDTLWSLAQRYEDPALSPSQRVDMIRQANPNLASALAPGQTLLVPVTAPQFSDQIHLARLTR